MWTKPHSIGWVRLMQVHFITYQEYCHYKYIIRILVHQKYFKPFFHHIRFCTKIVLFDHAKFTANISSEDGVWREFLEIDSDSEKWMLQKRNFSYPFFQSISSQISWLWKNWAKNLLWLEILSSLFYLKFFVLNERANRH